MNEKAECVICTRSLKDSPDPVLCKNCSHFLMMFHSGTTREEMVASESEAFGEYIDEIINHYKTVRQKIKIS